MLQDALSEEEKEEEEQVKEKEDARKAEEDFEYSFAKKMFAADAAGKLNKQEYSAYLQAIGVWGEGCAFARATHTRG